jgi:polyisoprenoid-binding protein YceI
MAWQVNPEQSSIAFVVKHLKLTTVRGRFHSFRGTLEMDEDNPQASSVAGTVDVASLKTGISMRDSNLMSADRFDAKRFAQIDFRSTRVGDFKGDTFKVYGDLTIKGITRPVVFDVVNKGELPPKDGQRRWAFGATISLNRKDLGIKWNALLEFGNLLVSDEVKGELEIQFVQE